jgi:hypothetical protein
MNVLCFKLFVNIFILKIEKKRQETKILTNEASKDGLQVI